MKAQQLRSFVTRCQNSGNYASAATFAEELCELDRSMEHQLLLAECLERSGEHRRLVSMFQDRNDIIEQNPRLLLLIGRSYLALGDSKQCLQVLGDDGRELDDRRDTTGNPEIAAALCVTRARAHDIEMNNSRSVYWYKQALNNDSLCVEALDMLSSHYLLSQQEQRQVMDSLVFGEDSGWMYKLYSVKLPSLLPPAKRLAEVRVLKETYGMKASFDLLAIEARAYMERFDYRKALSLTAAVINSGVIHEECIALHCICLFHLGKDASLYLLGHKLTEEYPGSQIGQFAAGCYYLEQAKKSSGTVKRAQTYFEKAVSKSWYFLYGWMGYAYAHVMKSSTDDVLRAYSRASRYFPGSHLPSLCTGMEYLATNQVALAARYLRRAKVLCHTDPMVLHELAVTAFRMGEPGKAGTLLEKVLELIRGDGAEAVEETESAHAQFLEPIFVNMGHTLRKRGIFEEAVTYFLKALSLRPDVGSTYTALGCTYLCMGNRDGQAIEALQAALARKPDDKIAKELLNEALQLTALEDPIEAVGKLTATA